MNNADMNGPLHAHGAQGGAVSEAMRADMAADRALLLDQQLCFALYSSSLLLTKLYKPHLDRLGLTYPQYLVMLVLWEHDDQVVHEVGDRLGLDSGTLTPLLKRMEAHGLILRQRDVDDERRVRVRLTEQGRTLKAEARSVPQAMRCVIGGGDDDFAALRASMQSLRQRLGDASGPG
jgi:DNA-binding MarR family transcriptional regulator